MLNYLRALDMVEPTFFDAHASAPAFATPQIFLDITDSPLASGEGEFRMETTVGPLVRIPTKGTRIAMDGEVPLLTPYDDCYLIMPPSGGNTPKKGARTVRLARPAPTPRL